MTRLLPRARPLAVLLLIASGSCTTTGASPSTPPAIDRIIDAPPFDQVHWGIHVVDTNTDEVIASRNARRKFIPASNAKLLVTAAALHALGPDHRYQTDIVTDGSFDPSTGMLDGDLVLVGSGDPTLSTRYWDGDPLDAIADSVLAAGVREVRGRLVVDASQWDSTTVAGSWMVFNLPFTHSATGGAFATEDGETTIVVTGGSQAGVPPRITWTPLGRPDFVTSYVRTVSEDSIGSLSVSYRPESRRLEVRGSVGARGVDTLRMSTRDPVREATAALYRAVEGRGISVAGGYSVLWPNSGPPPSSKGSDVGERREIATLRSPPLSSIVQGILEPSQNWMSEQVLRSLGTSDSTRASWDSGLKRVAEILRVEAGLDSLDVNLLDGSGLSAYNLVTPRSLVELLEWGEQQSWGPDWRDAMAQPGEANGTLANRLEGLENRVWAKTGTISNVNSLSGYLTTIDGRHLVFSILTNGSGLPAGDIRDAMDRVVRLLAAGGM